MAVPTNLATAPSGPNTWLISPGVASTLEPCANGYLVASVRVNGSTTCACQVLLISASDGSTIIEKVCVSGRTSSGRSALFWLSLIPVSICSST